MRLWQAEPQPTATIANTAMKLLFITTTTTTVTRPIITALMGEKDTDVAMDMDMDMDAVTGIITTMIIMPITMRPE